ncbi:MAG: hypothetical protein ABI637_03480 [Gemmatimonadota bacterium]
MGRRGIKEYRAPEALVLIAADREQRSLLCPSCGSASVERTPVRGSEDDAPAGKVTLSCTACGRSAVYIDRAGGRDALPETPRPPAG